MNDVGLTKAIERQRGEWQALSGDSFAVEQISWESVAAGQSQPADVIVFSSRHLGTLCERGMLRPVRESILAGDEYDASDVFPVVRDKLLRYGGQTMALPLAVQAPLLCYRSELVGSDPTTWTEYGEAAQRLADDGLPAAEPIQTWGAYLFLARAAPLAVHAHHEAVLFDLDTMKPRIDAPPFVRALEELGSVHAEAPVVDGACELVKSGRSGMAISFSLSEDTEVNAAQQMPASEEDTEEASSRGPMDWAQLPGSDEVFNPALGQWEQLAQGVRQVPLVGIGGRMAAVTQSSRNAASAFRLLTWLTSAEVQARLGPASSAGLPCRVSHLAAAEQWFGRDTEPAQRAQLSATIERVFSHNTCLVVPRIPGVEEYLAALQQAVLQVVEEKTDPALALQKASQEWEEITDRLDRQSQRQAYRRHLNLSD